MDKHYNPSYLEDTGNFLKDLKASTYRPLSRISGGTIIDLGCGTGADVIQLAALLGNSTRVVGIDHDELMLEKGISAMPPDANIEFIHSEAFPIPFEDESVAGLRAERLVQHLKDPRQVFNEINRVLVKDAPLVIVETDWPGLIFYNEHLEIEKKIVHYLTEVKVNNGAASRKLVSYMEGSGFNDIEVKVFPFVLKTLQEAITYLWIDRIIQEAADQQYISAEEHQLFMDALLKADAGKYFACSINMLVVTSVK